MSTETGIPFELVALFLGSCLIKSKITFLETVSKEKVSLPKFYLFTAFFIFKMFIFCRFSQIEAFGSFCEILVNGVGNFFVIIEIFIVLC